MVLVIVVVDAIGLRPSQDSTVAGKVSKKLKRQTRTLAQAIGAVVTQLRIEREWSQELLGRKAAATAPM